MRNINLKTTGNAGHARSPGALTLLAGQQEGHLAVKKLSGGVLT